MIKTEYKIKFSIDDDEFDLVIKEPNLEQKKLLEQKANEQKDKFISLEQKAKDESELNLKINEINETILINKDLIKESSPKDKLMLLIENKNLIKEKTALLKDLAKLSAQNEIINTINDDLENLFKFKLDLLLDGVDRDKFISSIKAKGISYKLIWQYLDESIKEAQEKK